MSDLIWLSAAQMRRIAPYFPLSHGVPRVDCSATIKVRKPVNQDEKVFGRLRRREGKARPKAQATET
jgi:hypothetical protein